MRPDQWDRVQELLDGAVDLPESERSQFVAEACPDDTEVRNEVASLLGFGSDGFIDPSQLTRLAQAALSHPEAIDGYRIVRCVGEGGMGVVYEAEQEFPLRRIVALKVIRPGMHTREVISRFEAERQSLALMAHRDIARVFDAGVAPDGRPYFVMEFAPGVPITQFCDAHRLSLPERLRLFERVCSAIHHAHQRGIIHRDIKPSNVLVALEDGEPAPSIIDFGIARAAEHHRARRTRVTQLGQVVGTLVYMSPEQAGLTSYGVDVRTDVYALGGLLYELLVGEAPLDPESRATAIDEFYRCLREEDPPRPSKRVQDLGTAAPLVAANRGSDPRTYVRALQGDLDSLVLKALEKIPDRRYDSASELARDVRRHLSHEPINARPPSTSYRVRKFARRHRLAVGSAIAILVLLISGTVGTAIGLVRARQAESRALSEAETSQRITTYLTQIFGMADPDAGGGVTQQVLREILDAKARTVREDLKDQPGVLGRVETAMGEAYLGLGLYGEASAMLAEALPLLRQAYGENHVHVYDTLNELGNLANEVEDYEAAREHFEQALAIAVSTAGSDSPDLPPILKNLGDAARNAGDLEAASEYLERALAIRERLYGTDNLSVAKTLSSLAGVAVDRGEPQRGIELAERSVEIRRAKLGESHPNVGYGHLFLGEVLLGAGQPAEALDQFRSAREIWVASHGPEHELIGECLIRIARSHAALGQSDEAYAAYREARTLVESILRPDNPTSSRALAGHFQAYAELLDHLGRTAEAARTRRAAADLL